MTHRVLFFGGRDFCNRSAVELIFDKLPQDFTDAGFCVVHGGARGADSLAGEVAAARGVPVVIVPANWNFYDKRAGTLRNTWMLDFCMPTYAVGLPGGRGTANMLKQCRSRLVPVWLPFGEPT